MLNKASTQFGLGLWSLMLFVTAGLLFGCSSMKLPILRGETGESLGAGRLRVNGELGTGRTVPMVPAALAAVTTSQDTGIFRSPLLGAGVAYGVAGSTDLQLKTFYSFGGGGWRLGLKNQFIKGGSFAVAGTVGYGQHSAKGSFDITDSGSTTAVSTVLSASQIDLGVPVSYRVGAGSILYSGLTLYLNSVSGSANAEAVSQSFSDFAFNLGFRQNVSARIDLSFELALAKLGGPFGSSAGMVPYFGLGVGVGF